MISPESHSIYRPNLAPTVDETPSPHIAPLPHFYTQARVDSAPFCEVNLYPKDVLVSPENPQINLMRCAITTDENGHQYLSLETIANPDHSQLTIIQIGDLIWMGYDPHNLAVGAISICGGNADWPSNSAYRSFGDFSLATPGLADSPESIDACVRANDSAYAPSITFTNDLGEISELFIRSDDRRQAVFESKTDSDGIVRVLWGDQLVTIEEIVTSLKAQEAATKYADPSTIELEIYQGILNTKTLESNLIFTIPITATPIPATPPTAPYVPAPAPTRAETSKEMVEKRPARTIVGTHLSVTLDCTSSDCFNVYHVTNPNSPEFLALLHAYQTGDILSPDHLDLFGNVIALYNDNDLCNWFRGLIGYTPIPNDVVKMETAHRHFEFQDVLFAHQPDGTNTFLVRNQDQSGNGDYYILSGGSNYLDQMQFFLKDDQGNPDPQGTQVVTNIKNDVPKADDPPQFIDSDENICDTPNEAVSGQGTGQSIAVISANYPSISTTTPGFEYVETNTSTPLEPTLVPHGLCGLYGQQFYLNPKTNQLLVRIDHNIIAGNGSRSEPLFIEIGDADTSPY